jgi:hypothetical protein
VDFRASFFSASTGGNQPQHRPAARRNGYPWVISGGAEQGMGKRQAVAGHAHKQMVFAMIIHPIGGNGRAFPCIGQRRAGIGKGIIAASGVAGMFGDIADTQNRAANLTSSCSSLVSHFLGTQ